MIQVGKAVLWIIIAVLCIGLLGPWQHVLVRWLQNGTSVATVDGRSISRENLSLAMREQLWRRGESWDSLTPQAANTLRRQALDHLIDCQLIPPSSSPETAKTDEELHWFQRQLGFETTRYASALADQQLTEEDLRERIAEQLRSGASLESLIASSVSEDDARAWFDQHARDLQSPEVWRVAHLFLSNHDPAKPDRTEEIHRLSTMLITGLATFDELVAQHSEDERTKSRRGDLGWFGTARMPADFMQAVASLRQGAVSPPIKTKLGWHLIKLIDSKQARDLTFDEARTEITCHLQNEQRRQSLETILSKLRTAATIQRNEAVVDSTIPAP